MLGQHVELTQDNRHLPVSRASNTKDLALAGLLHFHHVAVIGRRHGAVLLKGFLEKMTSSTVTGLPS